MCVCVCVCVCVCSCAQIISNGLFKRESLEKHTHQCRLLTLSVMEFIALYQVREREGER